MASVGHTLVMSNFSCYIFLITHIVCRLLLRGDLMFCYQRCCYCMSVCCERCSPHSMHTDCHSLAVALINNCNTPQIDPSSTIKYMSLLMKADEDMLNAWNWTRGMWFNKFCDNFSLKCHKLTVGIFHTLCGLCFLFSSMLHVWWGAKWIKQLLYRDMWII